MLIPRISFVPRGDRRDAPGRRSPSTRRFDFEQLEARTALSVGPQSAFEALHWPPAETLSRLFGRLEAAVATARESGDADTATSPVPDTTPSVIRAEILGSADLASLASEVHAGLKAALGPLPIASEDHADLKAALGSLPAKDLPLMFGRLEAAVATASQAGIDGGGASRGIDREDRPKSRR